MKKRRSSRWRRKIGRLATSEGKRASGKAIEGLDLRGRKKGWICLNDIDANEVAGMREKERCINICKYRICERGVFRSISSLGNFVGKLKDPGHFML